MLSKHLVCCAVIAGSVMFISGCSLLSPSEFQAPQVTVPDHWQAGGNLLPVSQTPWWQQFHDSKLDRLIETVLQNNSDLALATLTLQKARLQAGLSRSERWPELSANASASRSKPLDGGSSSKSYQASVSVSYEADLWGKLAASENAARWQAMASAQDRESTAQSLAATGATLYWQIGYLTQQLALSQQSIDYAQSTLQLMQRQYAAGAVSKLNVLEAQRNLASQQASHSEFRQQLTQACNALGTLLNQPQPSMLQPDALPQGQMPAIAAGLPASLLQRRPDVKAALYALKSALASKDATYASYFPALTLTGSVGDASDELTALLRNPVGTLGAGITLPFLQWQQRQLNNRMADIDYQTAVINYRKTLYQAFEDVNNALTATQQYAYQAEQLQLQYDAASAAEKIYESQYRHGAIAIQDWLDAQQNRRSAQASLLQNRYQQLTTQATLYLALGGSEIAPMLPAE
ncbi:efflux transporter outer membrane subunit [Shewanella sp. YIC-542]|uniref:efflux transporter outer membrane subunit n=1 Tax=Shewanella mytili TaxID=3377111 RepID=UPI00398EE5DF